MLYMLIFWLLLPVYGETPNHQIVVTPTDVVIYVGQDNSSKRLSKLISTYARVHRNIVKTSITKAFAPKVFEGNIKVYDELNIKYFDNNKCDYKLNAIDCGIKNNHWTIVSSVTIEKLHANFNLSLFNEDGEEIAASSVPIWGFVQLLPQYKKTTINESTMFGPRRREILEQYPPKRKNIPPLITSSHVSQAIMMLFLSIEVQNI